MITAIVIITSLSLFIIGGFLPAFYIYHDSILGWTAFGYGCLSIPFHPDAFGWYANIFYMASLALLNKAPIMALYTSFLGLLLASSVFSMKTVFNNGQMTPILSFGSGFYFWLFAQIIVVSYAFINTRQKNLQL